MESISLAIAEGLCSIDEDNKHTEEIDTLLKTAQKQLELEEESKGCEAVEFSQQMAEVVVSELLLTTEGKKALKVCKSLFRFLEQKPIAIKNLCTFLSFLNLAVLKLERICVNLLFRYNFIFSGYERIIRD